MRLDPSAVPAEGSVGSDVFGGGDVCESNTPRTFCTPHNGFEGRGIHQDSVHLRIEEKEPRRLPHAL